MVYDNVNFNVAAGAIEICYSSPVGTAQGNAEIYVDGFEQAGAVGDYTMYVEITPED